MGGIYKWGILSIASLIIILSGLLISVPAEAVSVRKFQTVPATTHFKAPNNTDVIPAKAGISLISRVNQRADSSPKKLFNRDKLIGQKDSKIFFIPLNDEAREYLYETVGPLQMPMVNGVEIPSLADIKSGEGLGNRLGSLPFADCMEMDQSEFEKTVAWASCHAGVENPLKAPRGRAYAESFLKPPSDEPTEEELRSKIGERIGRAGLDFFIGISGTVGGKRGVSLDIIDRIREMIRPTPPPPPPPPPPAPPPSSPPKDNDNGEDDGDEGDDEGDGEDPKTQPDPEAPSRPNPDCMEEDDVMSDVERGSPTYGLTNPVEGSLTGRLGRFAACIMEAELVPQISYCRTDEVAHCDNETGICTCRSLAEEGEGEPPNNQCQTRNIDCFSNPTHACCQ